VARLDVIERKVRGEIVPGPDAHGKRPPSEANVVGDRPDARIKGARAATRIDDIAGADAREGRKDLVGDADPLPPYDDLVHHADLLWVTRPRADPRAASRWPACRW